MGLFSRRHDSAQLNGLRDFLGHQPTVLGVGTGPRVVVAALVECLAWRFEGQPWQRAEWHHVRVGGWKQDASQMWWRLSDGSSQKIHLDEEGSFPSAFRDRVQATVAVQRRIELGGRREVLISGRRPVDGDVKGLLWEVLGIGGVDVEDPVVKPQVEAALAELRADYDF